VPTLGKAEVTRHEGIPVTTPVRTLLDLGAVLPRPELQRVVDEFERLGLFDLRAVEAELARSLAEVLAHWREPPFTRSEHERRFLDLYEDHRLPPPAVNAIVAGRESTSTGPAPA
jgi:hypothetical protein